MPKSGPAGAAVPTRAASSRPAGASGRSPVGSQIAMLRSNSLPMLVQRELEHMIIDGELAAGAKLNEIALKKDEAALKAQVMATGKSCKACHDDFRSPDYEKENEE